MFRLEFIPVVLGVLLALLGVALVADAWMPDGAVVPTERRRRPRTERNLRGELMLGLGTLCFAAALIGRDTWRFGTVAMFAGTALVLAGAVMNRRYLHERFAFRGAARRSPTGAPPVSRTVRRAMPMSADAKAAASGSAPTGSTPANRQPVRAEPQERRKHPR